MLMLIIHQNRKGSNVVLILTSACVSGLRVLAVIDITENRGVVQGRDPTPARTGSYYGHR